MKKSFAFPKWRNGLSGKIVADELAGLSIRIRAKHSWNKARGTPIFELKNTLKFIAKKLSRKGLRVHACYSKSTKRAELISRKGIVAQVKIRSEFGAITALTIITSGRLTKEEKLVFERNLSSKGKLHFTTTT